MPVFNDYGHHYTPSYGSSGGYSGSYGSGGYSSHSSPNSYSFSGSPYSRPALYTPLSSNYSNAYSKTNYQNQNHGSGSPRFITGVNSNYYNYKGLRSGQYGEKNNEPRNYLPSQYTTYSLWKENQITSKWRNDNYRWNNQMIKDTTRQLRPVFIDTAKIDVSRPKPRPVPERKPSPKRFSPPKLEKESAGKPIERDEQMGTIKRGRTVVRMYSKVLKENPYLPKEEKKSVEEKPKEQPKPVEPQESKISRMSPARFSRLKKRSIMYVYNRNDSDDTSWLASDNEESSSSGSDDSDNDGELERRGTVKKSDLSRSGTLKSNLSRSGTIKREDTLKKKDEEVCDGTIKRRYNLKTRSRELNDSIDAANHKEENSSAKTDRRISMELYEEQAAFLDSMIKEEFSRKDPEDFSTSAKKGAVNSKKQSTKENRRKSSDNTTDDEETSSNPKKKSVKKKIKKSEKKSDSESGSERSTPSSSRKNSLFQDLLIDNTINENFIEELENKIQNKFIEKKPTDDKLKSSVVSNAKPSQKTLKKPSRFEVKKTASESKIASIVEDDETQKPKTPKLYIDVDAEATTFSFDEKDIKKVTESSTAECKSPKPVSSPKVSNKIKDEKKIEEVGNKLKIGNISPSTPKSPKKLGSAGNTNAIIPPPSKDIDKKTGQSKINVEVIAKQEKDDRTSSLLLEKTSKIGDLKMDLEQEAILITNKQPPEKISDIAIQSKSDLVLKKTDEISAPKSPNKLKGSTCNKNKSEVSAEVVSKVSIEEKASQEENKLKGENDVSLASSSKILDEKGSTSVAVESKSNILEKEEKVECSINLETNKIVEEGEMAKTTSTSVETLIVIENKHKVIEQKNSIEESSKAAVAETKPKLNEMTYNGQETVKITSNEKVPDPSKAPNKELWKVTPPAEHSEKSDNDNDVKNVSTGKKQVETNSEEKIQKASPQKILLGENKDVDKSKNSNKSDSENKTKATSNKVPNIDPKINNKPKILNKLQPPKAEPKPIGKIFPKLPGLDTKENSVGQKAKNFPFGNVALKSNKFGPPIGKPKATPKDGRLEDVPEDKAASIPDEKSDEIVEEVKNDTEVSSKPKTKAQSKRKGSKKEKNAVPAKKETVKKSKRSTIVHMKPRAMTLRTIELHPPSLKCPKTDSLPKPEKAIIEVVPEPAPAEAAVDDDSSEEDTETETESSEEEEEEDSSEESSSDSDSNQGKQRTCSLDSGFGSCSKSKKGILLQLSVSTNISFA